MIEQDLSEYRCKKCGFLANDSTLVREENIQRNYTNSSIFAAECYDWIEYHLCPNCNIEFSFKNSNC